MKARAQKLAARGLARAHLRALKGGAPRRVYDNQRRSGAVGAPAVERSEPEAYTTAEDRPGLQLGTALMLALVPFVAFAVGMAVLAK